MKKYLFMIMFIGTFFTQLLSQTTITVPGQFSTIQQAIDYAYDWLTGSVTVLVDNGNYDKFEIIDCPIAVTDLTIESENGYENCIIDGNQDGTRITIHNSRNIIIQGFTIQDAIPFDDDDGHGVCIDSSYCVTIDSCHIINNTSDNFGGGIYALRDSLIEISNCQINNNSAVSNGGGIYLDSSFYIIENNTIKQNVSSNGGGIYIAGKCSGSYSRINFNNISENTVSHSGGGLFSVEGSFLFQNNKVTLNNSNYAGGMYLYLYHTNNYNDFLGNLIANNLTSLMGGGIYAQHCQLDISNCTITNNTCTSTGSYGGGINRNYDTGLNIINSILWGNEATYGTQVYIECDPQNVIITSVSYSCIEDGIDGIEFEDPIWIETLNYEINNIELDPIFASINPNDENYCYLTVESPCIDQGCPYFPFDPDDTVTDMGCYYFHHDDIHLFSSGWHWTSFPRIGIESNNNNDTDIVPILNTIEPFGDIENIIFDAEGEDDLTYSSTSGWFPDPYLTQSSWLYKIEIKPGEERILEVDGERLPVTFDLSEENPLEAGEYNWLGYWLPRTQDIDDAFGTGEDGFWQYVQVVKAEDWTYMDMNNPRGGDPEPKPSMKIRPLKYGKGYMVKFNETIQDFHWTDSGEEAEDFKRQRSDFFTYTEQPDYEVIDVMGIDPSVTEIGVFEDDECVGAVVVQDSCVQILVYSDNANRDPIPFNFEVVTGRGLSVPIKNYDVFNRFTGEFEQNIIISGMQEYSVVKLGEEGEPGNDTPSITMLELHGNYPNPFNPSTTISFSLPKEENIELTIYNIKGQKVKTLYKGKAEEGKHTMIWEGKDENAKLVSSGLYFYKLKTNNKELTKKMLLLK